MAARAKQAEGSYRSPTIDPMRLAFATISPPSPPASGTELLTPAGLGQYERLMGLGRKSWLFAGSERGADRAASMTTLIMTAKLNDVDPQAWLTDVLARIADMPQSRIAELLPWNWDHPNPQMVA